MSKNKITIDDKNELYRHYLNVQPRGPDKSVFYEISKYNILIGFHRLSIMDVSSNGDQPFIFENNERIIYLICNGEIYNFKDLIKKYDIIQSSNSDCETLIHLYSKFDFKLDFISELIGEYSFCICDINKSTNEVKVYAARDETGVRPLFIGSSENHILLSSILSGFPKSLFFDEIKQFKPANYADISFNEIKYNCYWDIDNIEIKLDDLDDIKKKIRDTLFESVRCRLMSDRKVGFLLSGGLDSSLVTAIAKKILDETKEEFEFHTFSIGMHGSTDEKYAKLVSKHIGSIHHHIQLDDDIWINSLNDVIKTIESYDVTTIRASTGQYLISKWIKENTDIKVLLIGDGSDELCSGYLYFHRCLSSLESHYENIFLLKQIAYFDVLRADRGISQNGLEGRVPFLDKRFIELYLSIDPKLRVPIKGVEKWLLRESFNEANLLPSEVLFRRKEAFSDGVSSNSKSWFSVIQQMINDKISDSYFEENRYKYEFNSPISKEALYFREQFENIFGKHDKIIPRYWLPKWCGDVTDPSARVLDVYKK